MREIKFRAWQKYHKRMVKVVNIGFRFEKITADYGEDTVPRYNTYDFSCFEVMQFTGLKDKNGKEIYEGDIIDTNGGRGEVIWNEELATWGVKQMISNHTWIDRLCDWTDEEVIGNVYENPELLKGDAP